MASVTDQLKPPSSARPLETAWLCLKICKMWYILRPFKRETDKPSHFLGSPFFRETCLKFVWIPGVNNQFLVETTHEVAVKYNDRSPLENLHCATWGDTDAGPMVMGPAGPHGMQGTISCTQSYLIDTPMATVICQL